MDEATRYFEQQAEKRDSLRKPSDYLFNFTLAELSLPLWIMAVKGKIAADREIYGE
jgi:hypothetical protein